MCLTDDRELDKVRLTERDTMHIAPRKAMKKYCQWCCNASSARGCNSPNCVFYRDRPGGLPTQKPSTQPKRGSLRSIRLKCLECVETPKDVRMCEIRDCVLWPFRMGRNPARKGLGGNPPPRPSKPSESKD